MRRPTYVCTTCSEHFTRKYSAKRHNFTVHHNNGGEIVTLVEYLVRRSSGRYQTSDPSWYRRRNEKIMNEFGRAMVADSMGDTFRPGGLQGQYQHHQHPLEQQEPYHRRQQEQSPSPSRPPPAAIQDESSDVIPYPPDQISEPIDASNDEGVLSHETILKIEELKRLMYRYSQYHHNPGAVVNRIVYYCNNGDNTLLDEKLEQLRSIDATRF